MAFHNKKIMAIILYSLSYLDMFRGPFFSDTVYIESVLLLKTEGVLT